MKLYGDHILFSADKLCNVLREWVENLRFVEILHGRYFFRINSKKIIHNDVNFNC